MCYLAQYRKILQLGYVIDTKLLLMCFLFFVLSFQNLCGVSQCGQKHMHVVSSHMWAYVIYHHGSVLELFFCLEEPVRCTGDYWLITVA